MEPITKYPLYAIQDKLVRAFALHGFGVLDCEEKREMLTPDHQFDTLANVASPEPVLLMDGSFLLRSSLLPTALADLKGELPLKKIAVGRTYRAEDGVHPTHSTIEGVLAAPELSQADLDTIFSHVVREAFGIAATFSMEPADAGVSNLIVTRGEDRLTFGTFAPAAWLTKVILGTDSDAVKTFAFVIDVDAVAIHELDLADRDALYSVKLPYLETRECACPSYGESFPNRARNILRAAGFREFVGQRFYQEDCYKKMNMIQESWDTNNAGVILKTPVDGFMQLPTVLAPSLEETLAENFKDGVESIQIFEIGQIYKPPVGGAEPMDILSISFGAYGPDMDKVKFRAIVDKFLSDLGIANHFFFPTTMAIAYDLTDCSLILDEKPGYLGGNFGGISPVARKNHGIDVPAWMCQLEVPLLEAKAASEYGFIPNELK